MSNLSTLLEAYAGKNRHLREAEIYAKEIIRNINDDLYNTDGVLKRRSVYRSSEACKRFEECLERAVGVPDIRIYWQVGGINAMTLAPTSIAIMNREKRGTNRGMKIYIIINEEIIYYPEMNERELVAMVLHEIGHNFYWTPFMVFKEILGIVLCPFGILLMFFYNVTHKASFAINDFCKKYLPILVNLQEFLMNIRIEISYLFRGSNLISTIAGGIISMLTGGIGPMTVINSITKYGNERGADSFAAKYGYGPELSSALNKLENPKNTMGTKLRKNMGPLGDLSNDMHALTLSLVAFMLCDPHPNHNQRAASMLKKLKRDYALGEYPPELENDLRAEINRMERIYDTINDNESNVAVKKCWFNFVDSVTDGHSDLREIFDAYYSKHEF